MELIRAEFRFWREVGFLDYAVATVLAFALPITVALLLPSP